VRDALPRPADIEQPDTGFGRTLTHLPQKFTPERAAVGMPPGALETA